MDVLIVGGGGREHALAWALARSPEVTDLYAAPGNPGIEAVATCVPVAIEDPAWANLIDLVAALGLDPVPIEVDGEGPTAEGLRRALGSAVAAVVVTNRAQNPTGAALTGARSATATSGPGFSLMAEGLGWAGMNEVPLVVTLYQRGGPSTGMPTRTEQADLQCAIHAGHGEFPRIIVASGDVKEAFDDAARAFNYAERYQTVVIHLLGNQSP